MSGLLEVGVAAGTWQPQLGDIFTILSTGDNITGTFATATMPNLAPGWTWNILYAPNSVALPVRASPASSAG